MENPKCPYCGGEMEYQDQWIHPFYICLDCYSQSPRTTKIEGQEEAFAAAMKRDRAKGEWGKPIWEFDYLDRPIITGSACSICHKVNDFQTRYCPNCGADMREEVKDEP